MTPEHARDLVAGIRVSVEGIQARLVELWEGRAWLALGHATWGDMCAAEFDSVAVGRLLPRDERRELVTHLADAGMSSREIGTGLGMSYKTAQRDLGGTNVPPTHTPSGIPVPEGDNPADYESDCHVDPSGGLNELRRTLRHTEAVLRNVYANPGTSQLDVIAAWLERQNRRTTTARRKI